jgi:GNAT superfamily N-acetyltransferase
LGNLPTIRSVTRNENDRFVAAMTVAFSADALARWAWPDPLEYITTFTPLVTLFGGKSFDHDSAFVIGNFFGVAQWLPPDVHPDDGPIGELFEKSLFEQMARFHPEEPHWYLPLIGVDPVLQGRGYGAELMRHALLVCDRNQQPAYLEATSPGSRALYERHGFRAFAEIRSGQSPLVFPMLREPRQPGPARP